MAETITHGKRNRPRFEGVTYHITTRCNNRQKLMNSRRACDKFISILKKCKDKYNMMLHDLVIMLSHVHLVICPGENSSISDIMHFINRGYAYWYNSVHERKGHFWEDRFYGEIIKDDFQLLAAMRYIDLNPVRANYCKTPTEWKYSGARLYLKGEPNELLDIPQTYINLGKTPEQRQKAYANIFPFKLESYDRVAYSTKI
jgi:putative transposase